jgi:Tol biopolymer transport system component
MIENPFEEESPSGSYQFVYMGGDGNVWVHPGIGEQPKQVTTDASGSLEGSSASETISYYFPQISSDGAWITYRRDVGTPSGSGMQYAFGLWVHNLETGKSQQVLSELPGSFTWRPGTHQLTYTLAVPENYFSRNPPDSSLARSVMSLDADTNKTTELLQPERGYSLAALQWSTDGRYLGFDELVYIEGRGPFGYYDFNTNTYVPWEERIGNYAWHPTESRIYYDYLTYVATGTEEIFYRELEAENEQRLTVYKAESEYAFWPVVSPDGDQIAYLAGREGLDNQTYQLMIQDLAGGEPVSLGSFVSVLNLSWSPDGSTLLFSAGPWETQKVMAVNVSDGSATALGLGTMVDVAENVQ